MIKRFKQVSPELYRGSAPSPKDVMWLKNNLGINKIVSLDHDSGERIDRSCKLLNINHIKLYIDYTRSSLMSFITKDLKKIFLTGGPTFVHCFYGKDRTGLAVALVKCKYFGMDPYKAIEEAKSLGFGIGVDPKITNLYEKIIKSCKSSKDKNDADIVSNERDYIGDNRDGVLDEAHRSSFAPYLDHTRQYPENSVYNPVNEQSNTRENRLNNETLSNSYNFNETDVVPAVGIFNNDAGIHGAGPAEPVGGFIYD